MAEALPYAESLQALKRARVVMRLRMAGRGTFLSSPNAMISRTATITHGSSTIGESKNHDKGCCPSAPQMAPISP